MQANANYNSLVLGYVDARRTLTGLASYEWHQLTKKWLKANKGTPKQLEAKRHLLDGLQKREEF